ncbi:MULTISPECIES: M48 family metalloprotease [Flavobacteriaceae]|uniref:M48 family metallopeptidase n=2 Tax=Flavobacteriaceae TaxID=49546 RepID=A0ABN1JHI3_9FLAO|nr:MULTISPECIES: M48 family metalloprotease [Meridianimaribacter]RYH75663.1 M48 family peptidase [Flavobacteriaceae bacterium 144Ye]TBV27776.1 M48 family peptidase [Meridianimaribacter sp. CL38]TDY14061.1 peptidase M48-like protein [Meridianimaribacter flavus]
MRSNKFKIRLLIGIAIVAFAFIKRCSSKETNPFTGRVQTINMTSDQEIAIGLQSAPQMAQQHGGLHPNESYQALVDNVGNKLVSNSIANQTPYQYEFHLLADPNTINAFALPGGQIFITYALFSKLENEDQLAGVLGHEIGHVLGRHSAERIAESEFWSTVTTGASVGADMGGLVSGIGQQTLLTNGRGDELESDDLGVKFMIKAGYNPEEMIGVMEILKAAAGPNRVPEFQSTHPDPDNRIEKIREAITKYKKTP